jgi:peptidoglycan/LPS O-acetylase OafA/YrhL
MFFVLSGLVLGMGLQREGRGTVNGFLGYCVRRVFRLYPLLLLSTVGIVSFLALARMYGGANFWFNHVLTYRSSILNSDLFPSTAHILGNILALRVSLNLVTWTLGVEVVCSLLLPLAHYARVRLPASGTWLLLAFAGFLALLGKWFLLLGWVKLEGAFNWELLNFFYLFYLGYLLPIIGPACFAHLRSSRAGTRIVLLFAIGLLFTANRFADTYRLGAGVGAWILLGVLLYGFPLSSFRSLDWPVVRFFGRISYGFYLLHDLVLIVCARLGAHYIFQGKPPMNPFVSNLILLGTSIVFASFVAWATHRWIELPFIQAGRQLAGRLMTWSLVKRSDSPANIPAAENFTA